MILQHFHQFLLIINSFLFLCEFQAEVIFLGQLSHPNLVKLIGYCCEDEHRVLIYEYMPRGSVENNLFSSKYIIFLSGLPWRTHRSLFFFFLNGK